MSDWPENRHPVDPALLEPASPIQRLLDYHLTGWGPGYARFEMPMRDDLRNRHDNLHGSIYVAMLDTAMGYSGAYTGDRDAPQFTMTLSLTTNFLTPARGPRLMAEGLRTGGGRRTFFAEGRMWDGAGTLVATGSATFRLRGSS